MGIDGGNSNNESPVYSPWCVTREGTGDSPGDLYYRKSIGAVVRTRGITSSGTQYGDSIARLQFLEM